MEQTKLEFDGIEDGGGLSAARDVPRYPKLAESSVEHVDPIRHVIAALVTRSGEAAEKSGWHEDRPEDESQLPVWRASKIALMHSELSEALEELRDGTPDLYFRKGKGNAKFPEQITNKGVPQLKPEGVAAELADEVIRIMDYCWTEEIDLAEALLQKLAYNETRSYRHGGRAL